MTALVLLAVAAAVAGVDLATKLLVERTLAADGLGHRRFGIRVTRNSRGSVAGWSPVVAATTLLIAVVALVVLNSSISHHVAWAIGLGVGGAAANLGDRVVRGAVVDFIVVGPWPAFNVADAALVVSAVLVPWFALS